MANKESTNIQRRFLRVIVRPRDWRAVPRPGADDEANKMYALTFVDVLLIIYIYIANDSVFNKRNYFVYITAVLVSHIIVDHDGQAHDRENVEYNSVLIMVH